MRSGHQNAAVVEVDTLVIGAGVGGLTVARSIAEQGRTVMVVEIAERIGGSAILSEGYVWTAPSLEAFQAEDPQGDDEKFVAMSRELDAALDDIARSGVGVGPPLTAVLGFGHGRQIDIAAYLDGCAKTVSRHGGWVMLRHKPEKLLTAEGRVLGAVVTDLSTGDSAEVRAGSTVLATGGFHASETLRAELMGEWARSLLLRANPRSLGVGIELGRAAGGALSSQMDRFYGHLVPSPLTDWHVDIYTRLTNYHSKRGLLLDRDGLRFTDEYRGDHANAQAVARRGPAVLFIDDTVWREAAIASPVEGMPAFDRVLDAREFGAHVSVADSVGELVQPTTTWGFDAVRLERTILDFNAGKVIPARGDSTPMLKPPFALVEVQPAITFTYGGLSTDTSGRVLDEAGFPIPGLFAAGVDAGGVNGVGYTGGLVRGLTLGRLAARAIVEERADDQ